MSKLSDKHEAVMRKAAAAVRNRGHEGDARLADSLLGIIASLNATTATATTQPVAAPEQTLQDWLTIIHDNELSLGDRLQRLSVQMSGILRGDAPDKFQPHTIREQCHCALDYERALADHRRLVRELDVLLNGEEGAAKQASLCDIVAQVRREGFKAAPVQAATDEVRDAALEEVAQEIDSYADSNLEGAQLEQAITFVKLIRALKRTTSTDGEKGGAA